ncbi:nitrate/nitrite transporter NrtS [Aromatoleum toluvorans]|uniref:nitrate/nitrite transporter NrtS n=1 Tax=Aromatoleum toluvorans TaxID=92002 RepID=UPI00145F2B0A|nr:nitrate/nitrite transporter NrtS [Aromatoleum toluvorans]
MAATVPRRGALVRFLRSASSGPVRGVAVRVALTVGTILNLINQGGPLIAGEGISWTHVALNYLVPYCVSSYSAARNEMRRDG